VATADVERDRRLLQSVRDGDADAYGALYDSYSRAARAIARRYTRQEADAADVVSEAFAGLYSALVGGKGPEDNVRGYLNVSIRNAAAALSRRGQRVFPTDDTVVLDSATAVFDDPLTQEQTDLLAAAWPQLPPRWQYILRAVEIDGRRPREIAGELDISPNAVAALAKRARQGLRAVVAEILEAGGGVTTGPARTPCPGETTSQRGNPARSAPQPARRR
jgi:RNA polymerase sigma factor (sigma-70 family)